MFKTLRVKLLVFFLLTTLTPLLFLGYISYQSQKQELTNYIEQSLLTYSNELASEIERTLYERISDVKHLATNPILKEVSSTNEEIQEQFIHFMDVYDFYSDTIFVKPDGIVSISSIDKVIGSDLNDRKWFQASIKGDIYLSDIYLSPVIHEPVLVMSAPVFNESGEEVVGVISPLFDLNYLWQTFTKFSEQDQIVGLEGYAFLINKNGEFIAHPDHRKILNENHLEKNNLNGSEIVYKSKNREIIYNGDRDLVLSYEKINKMEGFDEDWFVGVSVSKGALFLPLQKLLTNYLLTVGFVLFLTTIAVFKLSKYIVSPVERLVAATSDFATGKAVTPLNEKTYQEIDRLNQTFTTMTKKLAQRERGHKKSTLIIETTDNGVIAVNKKTMKITTFNRTCEKLFHLPKYEVVNRTVNEVMQKSDNFKQFVLSSKVLEFVGEEKNKKFELQCSFHQNIYHFFISVSSLPSIESEEIHDEILIVINDLTEKRQMERELVRSEKLKVVGQMAAGLAHEIRNPLAIIRGFIQLFSKEEEVKKTHYDLIIKEIDRVNYFITDLLNLSNPKSSEKLKKTNINSLLEDMLILQKAQLKMKGIDIEKEFEQLPTALIDPCKLQQVFINIIQNAVEAIEGDGVVTITTKHLALENKIAISILDTGCGMNTTTIEKLGTPFYSTKQTGTGLGLATSFRIIEEMNGTIMVSSDEGRGSRFVITLPY